MVVYEINKKKYVLMNMTFFDEKIGEIKKQVDEANELGSILRKVKYQVIGIIFTSLIIDFEFLVPEAEIERFVKIGGG